MNLKYVVLYKFMVKYKNNLEELVEDLEDEIKTAVDLQEAAQLEIERKRDRSRKKLILLKRQVIRS